MAKNKLSGKESFEQYYSSLYGQRWNDLKESFSLEPLYATFKFENCEPYYLDAASVFASSCLPLENSTDILDMCAAPGGKSLILASRMSEDSALVCNERSAERRNRLCTVVKESLSEENSIQFYLMHLVPQSDMCTILLNILNNGLPLG